MPSKIPTVPTKPYLVAPPSSSIVCLPNKIQMVLLTNGSEQKGGTRAAMFVYATEVLESLAFVSTAGSLVTYLFGYMNFGLTKSAMTVTNFMGTSFLLALLGGFISDTYLSRFKTCVVFGCIELVGYALLTIQAHFPALHPVPCKGAFTAGCEPATGGLAAVLYAGLYLIAIGTSGVKAALPALGADQFDKNNPIELPLLSSFFNWFLLSLTIGSSVGTTFVMWIGANLGWEWGYTICTISIFIAIIFVCMGCSFYRDNTLQGSAITRILQVIMAAARNWKYPTPALTDELHEKPAHEAAANVEFLHRTYQFRFLDRAAIKTTSPDNMDTWRMCTVTQVEETKILLRMVPIILSTTFLNVGLAQLQTFTVQQGLTMDTRIGGNGFRIPPASLPIIPQLFMIILVPFYDRFFVPFARRLTGIPTGIRPLQRIGAGLVLSVVAMVVAGFVEVHRKLVAVKHDMVDSSAPLPMSVFWLGYQYAIFGIADLFTFVGLLEFFYSESSAGMKSLSTAISWCSLSFGFFGSSVAVEIVNRVSGGWLAENNLNRDRLEYFYWTLAGLSIVNFGVYLGCASWYKYKKVDVQSIEEIEMNN